MTKLIAIDLDGTLLNWRKKITNRSRKTLVELQKKGNKVVLATGRSYSRSIKYAKMLKLDYFGGYLACLNGSLIYDLKKDELISNKYFEKDFLLEIFEHLSKLKVDFSVYKEDKIYQGKHSKFAYKLYRNLQKKLVEDISEIIKNDIQVNKIIINQAGKKLHCLKELFEKKYSNHLSVSITSFLSLELTPKDGEKGFAVKYISEILGVDKENIWAFGNHGNDIGMIKNSGRGIVVNNAVKSLKEVASDFTDSNNNDGVSKYLEMHLLNKKEF